MSGNHWLPWTLLEKVEQFPTPFIIVTVSKVSTSIPHGVQTVTNVSPIVSAMCSCNALGATPVGCIYLWRESQDEHTVPTARWMRGPCVVKMDGVKAGLSP